MKHVKSLLIFALVLNSPGILYWLPQAGVLFLFPILFWINVPAAWCGIGEWLGPGHFDLSAFGYSPLTPWAWLAIVAFWLVPALGLTVLNAYWPWQARTGKWRFSVRTLLVVMTMVAVALGLLVWLVTGGR
jgi:hypothetical protein